MMTTNNNISSSKLPRVVWHPGGRQFASRIGFKLYKRHGQGVRDRAFQLLGKSETEAVKQAIDIAADWQWTIQRYKESRPGEKPCWLAEHLMQTYQAAERGGLDAVYQTGAIMNIGESNAADGIQQTNDEQLAERRRQNVTLEQGKALYLNHVKSRIGLAGGKGIQEYTYISRRRWAGRYYLVLGQEHAGAYARIVPG